jgi:hypothetical protein
VKSIVAEHDPQAFEELFESEPGKPTPAEAAEWTELYTRLTQLLQEQLDDTRRFTGTVPKPMRQYLEQENVKILAEELEIFQGRLAFWQGRTGT